MWVMKLNEPGRQTVELVLKAELLESEVCKKYVHHARSDSSSF